MSNREQKHLHKERLCYHCDELVETKEDLSFYTLSNRGYGSQFDSASFVLQLCSQCDNPSYDEWFNEHPNVDGYVERFQHEEQIDALIRSFPIENQEYIWNHMDGYTMERRDWIDMELGLLPDEVYESYGMYSPREIKAYQHRFSTCKHPVNLVYSDQSKSCACPFGAYGEEGQIPSVNISSECFHCVRYEPRVQPIKEMNREEFLSLKKGV